MVVDPHHFNVDPDPAFHFNADPDPTPLQNDGNLRQVVFRPPRLHFEPLKLLNFNFNADPDPAFHSQADRILIQLPKILGIWICNPDRKLYCRHSGHPSFIFCQYIPSVMLSYRICDLYLQGKCSCTVFT
jgi:hypothetical protein